MLNSAIFCHSQQRYGPTVVNSLKSLSASGILDWIAIELNRIYYGVAALKRFAKRTRIGDFGGREFGVNGVQAQLRTLRISAQHADLEFRHLRESPRDGAADKARPSRYSDYSA
jgi:hypothetical protein